VDVIRVFAPVLLGAGMACTDRAPQASLVNEKPARTASNGASGTNGNGTGAGASDETTMSSPAAIGLATGSESPGTPLLAGADPPSSTEPEPVAPRHIEIVGRQLRVDGKPLLVRGVCWNPVPIGATHPEGLDYAGYVEHDAALMRELGVNVVRTYEPLLDTEVLDRLADAGIYVINSLYPWGGSPADVVIERVRAVRNHPAILMWAVGNEWNYNGLYVGLSHEDAVARLNEAVALIKAEDSEHPIATIYGELPDAATLAAMPDVDVWGINAYRGISFGDLFEAWQERSAAPMFVSEYGADAYNADLPGYDPESQAEAVAALTREIFDHASSLSPEQGVSLGGTLFEWADEWWKDQAGSLSAQDVGGIAPGGGPYPDQVFNEEWWGLVDIEREERPAFAALGDVYTESTRP
jgi:hypothetical protein